MKKQIMTIAMAAVLSASSFAAFAAPVSAEWVNTDGKYSYTDDSSKNLTVWQDIDGSRYFFGKDGTMRTGWRKISGKTYYFSKDGKMRTGKRRINGKVYSFDKNGALISKSSSVKLSANEVLEKLKKSLGDSYTCDHVCEEKGSDGLEYYGFDMTNVENWAYENNSISAINMDTALILKVKDGYADEAVKIIQERFDSFGSYALTYGYDQYRVKEARLFVKDNYVGFFILGERGDENTSEKDMEKFAARGGKKFDKAWEDIFGEKPRNIVKIPRSIFR